jgi:signal transduction histidine kinase
LQPLDLEVLAQAVNRPVDALGLLSRALRNRAIECQSGVILDEMERCLGQLRGQLASTFDVVRAEHCLTRFDQSEFLLGPLLEKLALQVTRLAHDHEVPLSIVPTSARVVSDPMALEVILRNLIVNGLFFASGERVLVGCRPRGDTIGVQVWWCYHSGQSSKRTAAIVDPVQSFTPSGDRQLAGPRLGLTLMQDLARALGHRLERFEQSTGLMFSLTLPRALP